MNSKRLRLMLKAAWLLHRFEFWLFDIEDGILRPLIKDRKTMPLDDLERLIRSFPPGYYRSELRLEWRERKGGEAGEKQKTSRPDTGGTGAGTGA